MLFNRKALSGTALVVLAVLFVAVMLLVNVMFRGARIDLTQSHLYTLSDGTTKIINSIDEPINLYLYFSDKGTQDLPQLRTYYTRVREMLEEMASRSGGKIKLELIDPLPFSEDEDRAASLGLQAVPVGVAGEKIFFGLAGTNSTNGQSVIQFFQPDKESFLEYDVAKLIHELSVAKKPVVGLLSGLPLAASFDPQTRQMREGWAIDQQWSQLFEIKPLTAAGLKSIDKDVGVLVVVHPKQLPDDAQYAIDQFVLHGGHLLVFVDPLAELDDSGADPNNPMASMMADKSSDLPKLFKAWGIEYDPKKVVLDRQRALPISMGEGQAPVRHPAILGFTAEDLNRDEVTTANLDSINVSTTGYFELSKDVKDEKLTPLIQTTGDATTVPSERLRMLQDPNALYAEYKPGGEHLIVAARLSGKFKTAFPGTQRRGFAQGVEGRRPDHPRCRYRHPFRSHVGAGSSVLRPEAHERVREQRRFRGQFTRQHGRIERVDLGPRARDLPASVHDGRGAQAQRRRAFPRQGRRAAERAFRYRAQADGAAEREDQGPGADSFAGTEIGAR